MGSKLEQVFVSFIFILIFLDTNGASLGDQCWESRCSKHGPAVRFPFRLIGNQSKDCGYPGFDLSCTEGKDTVLELPYSGKFFVRSIDYKSQVVDVYDPKNCISRRFMHFNFSPSASPFHLNFPDPAFPYEDPYLNDLYNFTLLNCSSLCSSSGYSCRSIPCLSVPGYQVYAFYSYTSIGDVPIMSCESIGTISFPTMLYYKNFMDFDLRLSWVAPSCGICEEKSKKCKLKKNSSPLDIECFQVPKPPHSAAKGRLLTKLVVTGVTIGFLVFVVAILTAIKCYHVQNLDKIEKENQVKIEKFLEDYKSLKPARYSYADIKRITNQFKNKLGQGGYGTVFKGKLSNEIPVAVKILNNSKGNGDEFINEVGTIGTIHHINVVRLVGFCADGFRRALVYEFLPNESLEKFIFSRDSKNPSLIGWEKLQDIAVGTAKGIEYLHQGCDQRILHFDIKPHNILLDHNFNPKISDFGLAKLCSKGESIVSMTAARGTIGYIAPEVFSRNFGNVSYKSDVYSFGMLLLEMVGGRKNIDVTVENTSQVYFPEWAYKRLNQGEELEIKVDTDGDIDIAKKLTIVALWCIQWYPVDRPSMKAVVQMLEGQTESLIMPPNPFASTTPLKNTSGILDKPGLKLLTAISEQGESH